MTTERIYPDKWGPDHLSTLLYLETRVVDGDGTLNKRHMRECDGPKDIGKTRLSDGTEVEHHDDWDCVNDLMDAGLAKQRPLDGSYVLTDIGWRFAGELRKHMGVRPSGKRTYADFKSGEVLACIRFEVDRD